MSISIESFNTLSFHIFSLSWTLFSRLTHYLDLYITDTALKVSQSLCWFTTSISHGVENYLPGCGIRASLMLLFVNNNIVSDWLLNT